MEQTIENFVQQRHNANIYGSYHVNRIHNWDQTIWSWVEQDNSPESKLNLTNSPNLWNQVHILLFFPNEFKMYEDKMAIV